MIRGKTDGKCLPCSYLFRGGRPILPGGEGLVIQARAQPPFLAKPKKQPNQISLTRQILSPLQHSGFTHPLAAFSIQGHRFSIAICLLESRETGWTCFGILPFLSAPLIDTPVCDTVGYIPTERRGSGRPRGCQKASRIAQLTIPCYVVSKRVKEIKAFPLWLGFIDFCRCG